MFWRNFALAMLALLLFACLFGGCATGSLIWINVQPKESMPIESDVDLEPLASDLSDQSEAIDSLTGSVESQGEEISDLSTSVDDLVEALTELNAPASEPEEETTSTTTAPPSSTQETTLVECLPGVTTELAQSLTKVLVQRVATECSTFVWRGAPGETVEATCPEGWTCTWDVVDDVVVVHEGVGQTGIIHAGTFRQLAAFPADDSVHNVCLLYQKEKEFGLIEVPSFEVRFQPVPGGVQQCS